MSNLTTFTKTPEYYGFSGSKITLTAYLRSKLSTKYFHNLWILQPCLTKKVRLALAHRLPYHLHQSKAVENESQAKLMQESAPYASCFFQSVATCPTWPIFP